MDDAVEFPRRDLLAHRERTTPEAIGLIDAKTGEKWTYREYSRRVDRLALTLSALGGRVGVVLDTRPAAATVFFAAMRTGTTLVPLSVRETVPELTGKVDRTGLEAVICDRETEGLALEVADTVYSVDEPDDGRVDALAREEGSDRPVDPVALESGDTQLVMFTSGTAGEPKAVPLTVGNLVASATASAFRLGVDPDDRWLCCLPTYHMGGLAPIVRSALYGTTVVVQRAFDPEDTPRVLTAYGVTGVSLVPTMCTRLLEAGWSPDDALRFVLLGGAPASEELLEACREASVPVCPTYGMTEAASQIATATPEEAVSSPGTVGSPLVGTEVTIVEERKELGAGETGEIVVSGPTVTPGYLDEGVSERAFGDFGLHTGDVGYRDEAGRLWVTGRLSDRIVTGGENVDPGEVTAVLCSHPDLEAAAVVGLPDPEWGERVGALVVPEGDRPALEDVLGYCVERLAGFKRPKTVGFAGELPRTASGTVDREAVRERLDLEGVDGTDR